MIARNERVREWCPLSLTLIYTREYVGNIVGQWQNKFRNQFRINQNILHDILLSDEQTVISETEYDFHWALEGASPEQRNCLWISRTYLI